MAVKRVSCSIGGVKNSVPATHRESLGLFVKTHAKSANLSQEKVAKLSGLSTQTVNQIIKGNGCSAGTVLKLRAAFPGVSYADLKTAAGIKTVKAEKAVKVVKIKAEPVGATAKVKEVSKIRTHLRHKLAAKAKIVGKHPMFEDVPEPKTNREKILLILAYQGVTGRELLERSLINEALLAC
jgi:transcriptional regulator with XRE-family HTH domain